LFSQALDEDYRDLFALELFSTSQNYLKIKIKLF
jgi:hypothetical protein